MANKTYGSGHFGEWIEDEHGLPAYRYTCRQETDPKAVTPVCRAWQSPTNHFHQLGNDRLVAVASNYGYVQVRQDEGGPKFLNDYDPQHGKFAGGFGYLTDGQIVLSTFYPGGSAAEDFERVFGCGYLRKTVRGQGYTADQVIFAPFGDEPLLISQVTLTNRRPSPTDLRWIEYWDCQMYQFSNRPWILATLNKKPALAALKRRTFARYFTHQFQAVERGSGLLEEKQFWGWPLPDRLQWGSAQLLLATLGRKFTGGAIHSPVKQAGLDDYYPPPTFLVSLDSPADGMATDSRQFFGSGGVTHPDGLAGPLSGDLSIRGPEAALFLERRVHLEPGAARTLYFAYGYLPDGFQLDENLCCFKTDPAALWEQTCQAWKADRIQLQVPGLPWVDRELAWHNYYLRSNLTYDDFFQEHILSQGQIYQYVIGFQGAARDPLQHALPLVFSRPEIVREVLRYTLKEVTPGGEIPYAITGRGMRLPVPFRPSDTELWLLWLASEYVLATRDVAFLNEELVTYPLYGRKAGRARVSELLERCYHHLVNVTGTGQHGLLRLSNGDWNDLVVIGHVPPEKQDQVKKVAESVLNSAMASYVLEYYGKMLTSTGNEKLSAAACQLAAHLRQQVRDQWAGRWFRRAWLGPDLGWVGDEQLWLEPQPWAILGGAATLEQTAQLACSIDAMVRHDSPVGARLLSQGFEKMSEPAGEGANGGIWASINGTLVWALAQCDGAVAWEEWLKNTLAAHAEAYPDTWYGIWSGPDFYNSNLSQYPGQTGFDRRFAGPNPPQDWFGLGANWTDFPVMNMHAHAWPLYSACKLLGV